MIILRADNRVLVNTSKFAYLNDNSVSGVSTITVSNLNPFNVGDPILLGEFGQFDAEILKVMAMDSATKVITLGDMLNNATTTNFSHSESTKISALPFDQIRFYWTPATGTIADENPVFDENVPLSTWSSIDPTAFYTVYNDVVNDSGFGWFMYKNALTDDVSQESNSIPYTGFFQNTAEQVLNDFQSLLNTNELKLVTYADMFSWLNEGLSKLTNKLNLTNPEFTVSIPQTVTIIPGVAEYLLQPDFTDMSEIVIPPNSTLPAGQCSGTPLDFIPVSHVQAYNATNPSAFCYYLRGRYLGFTPTPTFSAVAKYTYRAKSSRVTSLSTLITLPDGGENLLKIWMQYRAMLKFSNPLASAYKNDWTEGVNELIQSSVKRNSSLESWGISNAQNN